VTTTPIGTASAELEADRYPKTRLISWAFSSWCDGDSASTFLLWKILQERKTYCSCLVRSFFCKWK